jgi:hypothetical protein
VLLWYLGGYIVQSGTACVMRRILIQMCHIAYVRRVTSFCVVLLLSSLKKSEVVIPRIEPGVEMIYFYVYTV